MKWPTSARMLPCLLTLAAAALLGSGCSRPARERGAQFLDRGKKHLNEKDYERAILDLNNAARVLPTDPEPHYQLGLAYLAKGQVGPAVGSFKMACDRNPRHAEAQLKLAELLLLSNEPEMLAEADKHAQAGLALTPDSADALQTAAAAELRLGKLDQASGRLTRALGKDPQHLRSWFTLAAVKVASKNFAEAERTLRRAVEQAPRAVEAWIALGQFYLTVSKHSEAEDQFRRALEIDSKNGPAMLELARLQARDGRQEQAEKTLRQLSVLPDKAYRSLHAQFLFQAGRREAAIAELETLSRQDPQDREVRSRLVEAYLAVNRSTDAEKVLAEVLRRNSQDVDALEQRSRLYLSAGKADQAEADLLQVLRFRPASAQAHYLLAQAHKGRENRAGYRQELEEALKLDRSLLAARIEISESLRASRAGKTALELMEQAPQDQKARLEAVVERNWTLLSMGDYAAARRGVDQGMKTGRPTALLLQDGLLKMSLKNFAAARVSLEEVLRQTPEDLQALEALANTFVAEKRPAAAIERIRLQASRQPVRPALQHFLGAWLENSGDTAGARAAYAAAKSANPGFTRADVAVARLDMLEHRWDQARQTLQRLLSADSHNVDALLGMGMLEGETGNHAAAIANYRRILDLAPTHVPAMNNLAFLLADQGKGIDEALRLAQKAKELAPDSPAIDDTIGWAYYKKGLHQTAVPYLERSAGRDPDARTKYHLAMAYLMAGNRKLGQQTLEAATKLAPNLPEARMAREILGR